MIEELYAALQKPPFNLNYVILWNAYETIAPKKIKTKSHEGMLADIVSLIRFELGIEKTLSSFSDI
jgi:hypothetical protein